MKSTSLTLSCLLLINFSWSQNSNLAYKYAFKISNISSFEKLYETPTQQLDSNATYKYNSIVDYSVKILHPAISVQWKSKKNNLREIELTDCSVTKQLETYHISGSILEPGGQLIKPANQDSEFNHLYKKTTTTSIAMKYEYIIVARKSKEKKLIPSIGVGFSPFFKKINMQPTTSDSYQTIHQTLGVSGIISPRITYYFKSKYFIDLSTAFKVMNFSILTERFSNPAIPPAQQTISKFDFQNMGLNYSLRIGFGVKF